jgi:hypothetical protein
VTGPLQLTLQVPRGPARVGEPVPLGVRVTNIAASRLHMVGVVDGSETGQRFPYYLPTIRTGDAVVRPGPPEDPLVGPLRRSDVIQLDPGDSFDPTSAGGHAYLPLSTFANFRPPSPGRYTFELTLDTRAPEPARWLGRFGQDAEREAVLAAVRTIPSVLLAVAVHVEVH